MDLLEKATKYQNTHRPSSHRPCFHFSAPVGWLNDPNGFSFYENRIHLFFQYYPYATHWSWMYWGHAITRDFLNWEVLPPALAPDRPYDSAGCFSGTALIKDGMQLLFYTGVEGEIGSDGLPHGPQQQCLAAGTGRVYLKSAANPIIPTHMLPSGYNPADFRDPKIWEAESCLWLLAAAARESGLGALLLYQGTNTQDWAFHSVLLENSGRFGTMWECPDLFFLDGTAVVLLSIIGMPPGDPVLHSSGPVAAFLGSLDSGMHFTPNRVQSLDEGYDFYAPQTIEMPDGRRILIGWMQAPGMNLPAPSSFGWQGMMTFPRELFMKNGYVHMRPAAEIETAYCGSFAASCEIRGTQSLPGLYGRSLDLQIRLEQMRGSTFSIFFAQQQDRAVVLTWDNVHRTLTFDRSGWDAGARDTLAVQSFQVKGTGLQMRILLDLYSVEIFLQDGIQTFSAVFYPPEEAQGISFACNGSVSLHIEAHRVQRR